MTFLVALPAFGQEQQQPIQDLNLLVGKRVIVQRTGLCQPGTFAFVLSYAGKQAKVVSVKPSKIAPISQAAMDKLPPQMRAMIDDARKAATLLLEFEDGTQLDTCAPIGPSRLSDYLELAPGQTVQPAVQAPATAPATPDVPPEYQVNPALSGKGVVQPAVQVLAAPPATPDVPPEHEVKRAPGGNGTVQPPAQGPTIPPLTADVLSEGEVARALGGNGKDHWVLIRDMGLMAAQGNQVPSIILYMPEAVLAIRGESAKKQFTRYEPAEEDKRRSLMIVAEGYAGKTIVQGCTSITRVVLLSDASGGIVQEAYLSEPLGETWQNNFGATNECQALRAKFSLADVHKVRAAAPNGEFLVAVFAGSVNTKMYKVKKKHQSKLGLE
jgi:hypothetical protein